VSAVAVFFWMRSTVVMCCVHFDGDIDMSCFDAVQVFPFFYARSDLSDPFPQHSLVARLASIPGVDLDSNDYSHMLTMFSWCFPYNFFGVFFFDLQRSQALTITLLPSLRL
jgi:hypothetical protein